MTNGLLADFRCRDLPFGPGHHRTQDAQRCDGIPGRCLELQDGLAARDVYGDIIAKGARGKSLTEQTLDDAGAGGYLQPAPDVVQQIGRQNISGGLSDDFSGNAQKRLRVC